jgi:hypothetical protein
LDDVEIRALLVAGIAADGTAEPAHDESVRKLFRAGCHELARRLKLTRPRFGRPMSPYAVFEVAEFDDGPVSYMLFHKHLPVVAAATSAEGLSAQFDEACAEVDAHADLFPEPLIFVPTRLTRLWIARDDIERILSPQDFQSIKHWLSFNSPRFGAMLGSIVFNAWD